MFVNGATSEVPRPAAAVLIATVYLGITFVGWFGNINVAIASLRNMWDSLQSSIFQQS